MKKVLCFGDSNTYGFIPTTGGCYDKNTRWCGVLQNLLSDKFQIIEEGCNNRTGFSDNAAGLDQTGYRILPLILDKYSEIDVVIIAIGINDLQFFYQTDAKKIEAGMENLVDIVKQKFADAKIVIVAPSVITKDILTSGFSAMFDENSIEKSKMLAEIYEKVAKSNDAFFVDLNKVAKVSKTDGLHYEPQEHLKIAETMAKILVERFC